MTRFDFLHFYRKEMEGKPTDILLEQAFFCVGWLGLKEAEEVATCLLEEGYDSSSLVKLASGLADSYNINVLFNSAMNEIGLESISEEEAVKRIGLAVAERIVSSAIMPEDGASVLAGVCSHFYKIRHNMNVDWLWSFYCLDDAFADDYKGTGIEIIRKETVNEARKLLNMMTVP